MTVTGTVSADELLELLEEPSTILLDVREPDEFAAWRIPGAINIPLGQLAGRLGEVPEGHVITVCARGARAQQAAARLSDVGRPSDVLAGGMEAWGLVSESVAVTLAGAVVVQFRRRGKGCLSYLVAAGRRAVVIDPSTDVAQYVGEAKERGVEITHVLDTHLHADHLSGARELVGLTGAELLLNPADPFTYDFTPISDGLRITLDEGVHLDVSAVSAPGHTMGSTVYRLGEVAVFTGDTLFLESVGRPDLADEAEVYARALYRSLHEVVLALGDDTLVLPAHYGDAVEIHRGRLLGERLGVLRGRLAALALPEDEFVAWAVARVTDRPPNYREIVRFNAGSSTLSLDELRQLELGPNRCAIAG